MVGTAIYLNNRRIFDRNRCETQVRYEKVEENRFFDSRILNFGEGGLCLLSRGPLEANDLVYVKTVGHFPEARGPERFHSFLGEVRWCGPSAPDDERPRRAGVRIMAKNSEIPNLDLGRARCSCNLCGDLSPIRHATQVLDSVYLCPYCYRRFQALLRGRIRRSMERYLTGNVL